MNLSIIIPVRNVSALLDNCLTAFYPPHSALSQIIIVDCCSDDGIETVLAKHSDLPIVHLCGPDQGIYDAFNKGVAAATAELLFFLGADDTVNINLFDAADEFPNDIEILVGAITKGTEIEVWRPSWFGVRLLYRNIPHQSMIIKRNVLIDNPYDIKYPLLSDYAWNIDHFWARKIKYKFTSQLFCNWAPGGASQVRGDDAFDMDKPLLIDIHAPPFIALFYKTYRKLKSLLIQVKK